MPYTSEYVFHFTTKMSNMKTIIIYSNTDKAIFVINNVFRNRASSTV